MFGNPTIQSNITQFNGTLFSWLMGFGMMCSSFNYSYYIMDRAANKVYILNDNWSFVSFKTFNRPVYMITIENSLYMTGNSNVWKLDQNLNTLIEYNPTGTFSGYRGLYFNSTNGFLYVATENLTLIHVFDLNLTFNHSFSTSPYNPFSIEGYNNQMYIGTTVGAVLVFHNEVIVNQFNGCGGNSLLLSAILFDDYGYMATSSFSFSNLHFPNGSYTGKSMATPIHPRYIGFDSKGHFIQISVYQITIYN